MRRRFGADVVLAVLLPAACVLALFAVSPDRDQPTGGPPEETELTSASVVCPAALPGAADQLGVTTLGAVSDGIVKGDLQIGLGSATADAKVRAGRVTAVPSDGSAAVVSGTGELAPGLAAGRSQSAPLAAVDCGPSVPDQWFTAVGADATHDSVLQLVNPDAGLAVADITVRGPSGELDVPALQGVSVPGGTATEVDLGQVVPRRGELALEVHTSRGRLAVHVVDSYDPQLTGTSTQDWLPAQAAPATENVLLGLVAGTGERTLVLANPGADEVRAELQVVTPTSTYPPAGVEPIRVAPGATEAVSLDDVLTQAAQDGATGLLVTSSAPVATTLRQLVDGDLSLVAATPEIERQGVAVVPAGPKQLLLLDGTGPVRSTIRAYDGKGRMTELGADLAPDADGLVALPDDTRMVVLTPGTDGPARAAVLLGGTGAAVVPLRELVTTGRVPDVRPGVP